MHLQHTVGANLLRERTARQLSLGELSRRSGVSKQTIGVIESGGGNPTLETVSALAAVLQVSVRSLMSERDEDIVVERWKDAEWQGPTHSAVRHLSRVSGSGYVTTSIIRLSADSKADSQQGQGRGSVRHVLVLQGEVDVTVAGRTVTLEAQDFMKFGSELPHEFASTDGDSLLHVVTTTPEQSLKD